MEGVERYSNRKVRLGRIARAQQREIAYLGSRPATSGEALKHANNAPGPG
jgi:hypothetical protein